MTTSKKPRGFAAMHPDHVKATARKGGKAAHAAGTAHEFTSEEARAAGAKGGKATHAKRRAAKGIAPGGAVSGNKDLVVDVACSSAAGCAGTVAAGSKEASEAIDAPHPRGATPKDNGPSADENPEEMGSCGTGGCGSRG